jgi:TPR repeat protein
MTKLLLLILPILLISGCGVVANTTNKIPLNNKSTTQVKQPTLEKTYQLALDFYNKNFFIQASQAFLKASKRDHAKAQFRLAKMYYDGKGVDKKYSVEASKWCQKAAEQGHIEAQYFLGALYFVGSGGVAQSFSKTKQWYQKAAKQGHVIAQLSLGMMYYNGKGGQPDLVKTKQWLSLAAAQGNEDAILMLKKINQ